MRPTTPALARGGRSRAQPRRGPAEPRSGGSRGRRLGRAGATVPGRLLPLATRGGPRRRRPLRRGGGRSPRGAPRRLQARRRFRFGASCSSSPSARRLDLVGLAPTLTNLRPRRARSGSPRASARFSSCSRVATRIARSPPSSSSASRQRASTSRTSSASSDVIESYRRGARSRTGSHRPSSPPPRTDGPCRRVRRLEAVVSIPCPRPGRAPRRRLRRGSSAVAISAAYSTTPTPPFGLTIWSG